MILVLAGMRRSCSVFMPALHVALGVRKGEITDCPGSAQCLRFDVLNVRAAKRHRVPAAVATQAAKLRLFAAGNDLLQARSGAFAVLAVGYRSEKFLLCFHAGYCITQTVCTQAVIASRILPTWNNLRTLAAGRQSLKQNAACSGPSA